MQKFLAWLLSHTGFSLYFFRIIFWLLDFFDVILILAIFLHYSASGRQKCIAPNRRFEASLYPKFCILHTLDADNVYVTWLSTIKY